jgi:type II secretory pathway predicted ATPase ExeA
MEYMKFYKLDAEPFRNDPDQRFFFDGDGHRQARLRLTRGIFQRKGLSLLIGPPGCGKTVLAHHLLVNLKTNEWATRLLAVPHSESGSGFLLPKIAGALGVENPASEPLLLLDQISQRLTELTAQGAHPVLLIDDAQLLSQQAALEEFQDLLNLAQEAHQGLSVVLFGLPALDELLRLDASLAQRIDIRTRLHPMRLEQTQAYLDYRLERAGGAPEVFSPDAVEAIHAYSNGIPRLVNTLADNALFEGFLNEAPTVDASLVCTAADQLGIAMSETQEPEAVEIRSHTSDDPEKLLRESEPSWLERPLADPLASGPPPSHGPLGEGERPRSEAGDNELPGVDGDLSDEEFSTETGLLAESEEPLMTSQPAHHPEPSAGFDSVEDENGWDGLDAPEDQVFTEAADGLANHEPSELPDPAEDETLSVVSKALPDQGEDEPLEPLSEVLKREETWETDEGEEAENTEAAFDSLFGALQTGADSEELTFDPAETPKPEPEADADEEEELDALFDEIQIPD